MLVTIQQTKSNTENLFEVTSNGQLLFQAKAPWMKISLPFNAEDLRELTFSNPAGEIVYTTRYRFIDNLVEELIPFKYLLTKGQRFGQFEIIYDDEKQIAQITKPLTVTDNLDVYFLHIKDEYASIIPVLSFFTVYYDYRKYNHSGELTKNTVQISNSYTYGKNNDKYNPNWIAKEFGQQAADELEQKLRKIREQGSAQAKKIVKLVGLAYLVLILLAIVLFVVFKSILG